MRLSAKLTPPPPWHPPWKLSYLLLALFSVIEQTIQLTILLLFRVFTEEALTSLVAQCHPAGSPYPLHVSIKRQQKSQQFPNEQLCLSPLEHGIYYSINNLDQYNLFLLGYHLLPLSLMLALIIASHTLTVDLICAIKAVHLLSPKKPPDLCNCPIMIPQTLIGYITYSSTSDADTDDSKCIHESFSPEKQVIVSLDTPASWHLFPATSDFVSQIQTIALVEIHGVGSNIQAIGQGTVCLQFYCSAGKLHDKLLHNGGPLCT